MIFFGVFVDLSTEAPVLKIPIGIFEKSAEEVVGEGFFDDIEAEVAPVDFDKSVGATGCGNPYFASHLARD